MTCIKISDLTTASSKLLAGADSFLNELEKLKPTKFLVVVAVFVTKRSAAKITVGKRNANRKTTDVAKPIKQFC